MRSKQIKELIALVESSNIHEIEVSRFGKRVRITKNSVNSKTTAPAAELASVSNPPPAPMVHETTEPSPLSSDSKGMTAPQKEENANIIAVKSPMVGTFYRAPAPDADPYVQEGDIVTPNQVLCIIEAMKLMNEITSEFRGRVVEILAENGKPVEYDQVLFRVEKL